MITEELINLLKLNTDLISCLNVYKGCNPMYLSVLNNF